MIIILIVNNFSIYILIKLYNRILKYLFYIQHKMLLELDNIIKNNFYLTNQYLNKQSIYSASHFIVANNFRIIRLI